VILYYRLFENMRDLKLKYIHSIKVDIQESIGTLSCRFRKRGKLWKILTREFFHVTKIFCLDSKATKNHNSYSKATKNHNSDSKATKNHNSYSKATKNHNSDSKATKNHNSDSKAKKNA